MGLKERNSTFGVAQGSILGPLLFSLFINNLPDKAAYRVKVPLYAEDTMLYRMSRLQNTVTSYKTLSLIRTSGRSAIILDLIRLNVKY